VKISDHQQSWEYEDSLWKGPGPPLLVAADLAKPTICEMAAKRMPRKANLTVRFDVTFWMWYRGGAKKIFFVKQMQAVT